MLAVPGRQAVPLHPDLRQRLLLRVRHVQHHRLDRPRPEAAAGEELRPARVGVRRLPQGGGLLRPRRRSRPQTAADAAAGLRSCRRRRTSIGCSPRRRTRVYKGGREWRVDSDRVPDLEDDHRRDPRPRSRRPARAALAPERRRVAVRHRRARSASRCSARTAASAPRRSSKGDVGYIPQGYGHSIENVGDKPCRVLIGFNTGHLRGDRPVAMDRRQPGRRAGHQLRQAGGTVREVPAPGRVHRQRKRRRQIARGICP